MPLFACFTGTPAAQEPEPLQETDILAQEWIATPPMDCPFERPEGRPISFKAREPVSAQAIATSRRNKGTQMEPQHLCAEHGGLLGCNGCLCRVGYGINGGTCLQFRPAIQRVGASRHPADATGVPLPVAHVPQRGAGGIAVSSRDSGDAAPSHSLEQRPAEDLPGDWQMLFEEHGLNQFAAVALMNADAEVVGVLSLAAKGPVRPPGWTPEALHSAVGLMSPHIRRAQAVLASPALSQLHAAATFSDLVNAAAEAAVDVAAAVAYVRGQSRVAFIGEELGAAAIFQQDKQEGDAAAAQLPLLKARRSSCEFVTLRCGGGSAVRKSVASLAAYSRLSMDVASGVADRTFTATTGTERTMTAATDQLKRESWTPQQTVVTLPSFTFPSSKSACKGHTLTLGKTLLSEALSKQVAGLCIDDCQTYTVSMKAYPRDLVLSRGAVMPLSLALATISGESRPRMALYVTYGTSLPRPLLQAVVQELQQLLQDAVHRKGKLPSVPAPRISGEQLSDPCEEPQSFPPNEGRMLSFLLGAGAGSNVPRGEPAAAAAGEAANATPAFGRISLPQRAPSAPQGPEAAAAAAALMAGGATVPSHVHALGLAPGHSGSQIGGVALQSGEISVQSPPVLSPATPPVGGAAPRSPHARGAGAGGGAAVSAFAAAATAADAAAIEGEALEGDLDMEFAGRRVGGGVGGSGSLLQEAQCYQVRSQSACDAVGASAEVHGKLRARVGVRSVSFRLEAAHTPRGASKLAPIIASMHDRLRAAQAVQMTFVRSEAHKTDLKSLKLLQEIGQGGYGTVYRGTFHGTEVAVKIIKQSRLAGVQSSSNLLASSHGLGLHKQNLHDAIELVASVSMSHINIVQVPAYFMDVRLEKPEDFNPLDSVDQPTDSRPFRLVHSPSLLESPAPGQEAHGNVAMALVLEYCDCGSLCDAILNRKFIERVTPKRPPPQSGASASSSPASSAPAKTYLAINMRSVYLTLLEIALALRHMHSLALVHCDLKPQNVLLKSSPRDPRGFTAKLSDFGLAKMMAHDDEGQLVIDEAVASGTITHVAPEVLLGQKALGAAVDIYAFGVLMYQVLCGMKVYDKTMSASAIANAVAHRMMRPQLPAWVPFNYRSLAQACWHHLPSSRPTADELVRHLERALEAKRASSSYSSHTGTGTGTAAATAGASAAGSAGRSPQPRPQAPVPTTAASGSAVDQDRSEILQDGKQGVSGTLMVLLASIMKELVAAGRSPGQRGLYQVGPPAVYYGRWMVVSTFGRMPSDLRVPRRSSCLPKADGAHVCTSTNTPLDVRPRPPGLEWPCGIFVLSTADFWAATAACAGLGTASTAGRAYSSDPRFNGSAPAAILRMRQECPCQSLMYRSAVGLMPSGAAPAAAPPGAIAIAATASTPTTATASAATLPPGAASGADGIAVSSRDSGDTAPSHSLEQRPAEDLPGDWQMLFEEHGLNQFAAVLWTTEAGEPVGVLSLAAQGPVRPPGWTPEALHSAVGLMSPHIRRAQAVLASPALSQLHAAATFSDLVNAVAEAAVDVAAAVAYVRGQSRVAFIGENMAVAAIFQQQRPQPSEGDPLASVPLLKVRRSSCDFVMMPSALRKSATTTTFARISMDGLTTGPGEAERGGTIADSLKRESWNQRHGSTTTTTTATNANAHASNCNASFTLSFPKGPPCKGHTLLLHRTLLDEALSKQVAGLCIDDCQTYTVSMKAYPRDLVLSRGAVMPLSLALATISGESRPRMALYVTYGTSLPRPLLQAVVQELQQLLQAILPVITSKFNGIVRPEYHYLVSQLQDATQRRGKPSAAQASATATTPSGDPLDEPYDGGGPEEQRALSFILPGDAVPPALPSLTPSFRAGGGGGGGGGGDRASPSCAPPTPTAAAQAQPPRPSGGQAHVVRPPSGPSSPPAPLALLTLAHFTGGGSQRPTLPSNGAATEGDTVAAAAAAGAAAAGAAATREPLEGDIDLDYPARRGSAAHLSRLALAAGLTAESSGRSQSASESDAAQTRRLLPGLATRSVSFHLEAAQVPRGASKLAPIIASMHDRLRAAQAVQMTISGRSEARQQDLRSIKLLQEIGQGGYGTVYRGTFHGTEVAVKIIKQSRLAGVQSSSNLLASSHGLGLHKQNLHDAIELVASVSMSHINIVQVPAYFMDVRLEKPDDMSRDSVDAPSESRPFRLRHSPSLMESPKAGQELYGEGAMALVLEYCDCGSLCDAILNRKFIERVTPKKPPQTGGVAGGSGATPQSGPSTSSAFSSSPSSSSPASSAPAKTYLAINMRSVYLTLLEIALALRHMHSLALVHCDLKPQNVLLKSSPRDPRGFTAKLSDFGLAKMMAHDDEGQLVIDEAVASGTITHVAPEVLLGQRSLGAAVDIYAFGILMYQLLCGVKVYDKVKSASVIANAVAHRFMRPKMPSWVPYSYRSLAEACWAHEPSARPTADELVRHLEQAIESKRSGGSKSKMAPQQQQQPQPQQPQQQLHSKS
ncbi:hypothetical protein VOLCADRAFT_94591 [Volvox carteri f. nagariensis]|uniref:Protein kinase domain-containing protein n=1 Tax=Volvox carteri f. nagariensis TaxID=3068 RepID=D8U571_VOLCA|nr:uncharacterized protein VOLCADRAFT_94591 [Volvox carteri f. nagariensis]EFJ45099.1 hypothetical protein VOLCADRAFT_94591 [Volvox carteri f. nagariensis]|eukprot:XP_002953775.1 hypothetical protein VOLCADRAFT_94591 [Volvox carteri f. nagariensis]